MMMMGMSLVDMESNSNPFNNLDCESELSLRTENTSISDYQLSVRDKSLPLLPDGELSSSNKTTKASGRCSVPHTASSDDTKASGKCFKIFKTIPTCFAIFVLFISLASITISLLLITHRGWGKNQTTELPSYIPCKDLDSFNTDTVFNTGKNGLKFKDGVVRTYDSKTNQMLCEIIPMKLRLENLNKIGSRQTENYIKLDCPDKGPETPYSRYNMTIVEGQQFNNISSDRTSLIIRRDGTYFIHFGIQLTYGKNSHPVCLGLRFKTAVTHLLQHHKRDDQNVYKVLLTSEHTCCEKCDDEITTQYSAGLFQLEKNDRLFIQVSAPQLIGSVGNFLGIFRYS